MEAQEIKFNKQITVGLDWDGDTGTHKDNYGIEFDDYWVLFSLYVNVVNKYDPGDYFQPPEETTVFEEIIVYDIRVIDENSKELDFNYEELKEQIEENIFY